MLKQIEMAWSSSSESAQQDLKISHTPLLKEFEHWSAGLDPADQFLRQNNTTPQFLAPLNTLQKIPATSSCDDSHSASKVEEEPQAEAAAAILTFDDLETLFSEDISEEQILSCSSFSMGPEQPGPRSSQEEATDLQTLINKVESAGFIVIPAGEEAPTFSKGMMAPQEWRPGETTTEEQSGMMSSPAEVLPQQIDATRPFDPFEKDLSKTQVRISIQDSCNHVQEIVPLDLEHLFLGEYSVGEEASEDKDSPRIESVQAEDDQTRATKNQLHAGDLRPKQEEGPEERPLVLLNTTSPLDASTSSEIVPPAKKTVVVRPLMPVATSQKECKHHDHEEKEEEDAQEASPKRQDDHTTDDPSPVSKEEKQQDPPRNSKKNQAQKKKSTRKIKTKGGATTPTDKDILGGRGGQTNHFAGNKRYRSELTEELKALYKAGDKIRKTDISELFVQHVHGYGGRFLAQKEGLWFEILDEEARKRVAQALREDNTPEARAAKRQRFVNKRKSDKKKTTHRDNKVVAKVM